MSVKVKKRNGKSEELNIEKIHKVLFWATSGLKNVSVSDIEVNAKLQLVDGITTRRIHEVLIQSAVDLISNRTPEYTFVASKLLNYLIRKDLYNEVNVLPSLYDVISKNVKAKIYDPLLLELYTKSEIDACNDLIKHERDYEFTYAGLQQVVDKYLCKNRISNELYETPQMAFMAIAMTSFAKEDKDKRFNLIRRAYNAISQHKINLPTPIIAGVRTPLRQYSSCTLIDMGDSLEGILNAQYAIGTYAAKRAGIGVNIGRIRGEGEPIRNGEVVHTGMMPILKTIQSQSKEFTQNAIRTGSTTVYVPFFHKEIESILVLKNNKGTDDNRVRHMDYGVQFNELFFQRVKENGVITLFPTGGKPEYEEMYESFFISNELFKEKYEALEHATVKNKKIKKVSARALFAEYCKERFETGRIYTFFSDNVNTHGSFNVPLHMSNLCAEITLPVKPLNTYADIMNDGADCDGEIALCVLAALNMGTVDFSSNSEMEDVCDIIVRILDNVIEYQEYPINAARKMLKRRSLGIGVTNFAYWMAKNKMYYTNDQKTLSKVDEAFESFQYYLLKASNKLAQEKGACEYYNDTKYSQNILPIDKYKKTVDELVTREYSQNWVELRENISKFGLRNSVLSAEMPVESSSVVSNSTNGIEPPRKSVISKVSKQGVLKMTVPEVKKLEGNYTYAFEMMDNKGYLAICAVIQKWIDQAISANCYYDPKAAWRGDEQEIKMKEIAEDIIFAWKYGMKTLYYSNTNDGAKEDQSGGCGSGGCSV